VVRRIALLLTLLFSLFGFGYAQVVENTELRLEVSPQTGSIIHLLDKRNQTDYISDQKTVRLFEILIPDTTNYSRRIASWKQQAARVETKGDQIEIRYDDLQPEEEQYKFGAGVVHVPEPKLHIVAEITLQLQGEHINARMHIQNKSFQLLTGVAFPYIGGMPAKLGNESAKVILPSMSQRVFPSSFGELSGQRAIRYPGVLAASWLSYEFPSKGLGIEAKSGLDAQDAYFSMSPGPFQEGSAYRGRYEFPFIAWIQYPHIAGQTEWTSPELTIHVHNSDWHALAAEHREWFRGKNRPAPSEVWDTILGFATFCLKSDDNTIRWKYSDLPKLAADSEKAGFKKLVIEGWREQEGLRNPAPYGELADPRMGGGAALKQAVADLKKNGVELFFAYHSGLMNVRQDQYPPEHAFWAVKTRRGANQIPVDFSFETPDYPNGMHAYHYWMEIDPTSGATDYLLREARRIKQEYGFQNLFLKGIGQRAFLSYNRYQGVAPQDAYAAGYKKLLGGLREIYADGLLLNEGFNDLVNPYGDGAYTWDQTHDTAILSYSLPWSSFSNDVEALEYETAVRSFANKTLINLVVDAGQTTVADYTEFAQYLLDLQRLKAATRPYYADGEFRDHDGLKNVMNVPGTVVTVFTNRTTQKTGIVLANLTEQSKSTGFELQLPMNTTRARVFPQGSGIEEVDVAKPVSVQLAPHQIVVLAIDATLSQSQ